jgi:hypothetical protein
MTNNRDHPHGVKFSLLFWFRKLFGVRVNFWKGKTR